MSTIVEINASTLRPGELNILQDFYDPFTLCKLKGNIPEGTQLQINSGVIIDGDVGRNSTIQATGKITVQGVIERGAILSGSAIQARIVMDDVRLEALGEPSKEHPADGRILADTLGSNDVLSAAGDIRFNKADDHLVVTKAKHVQFDDAGVHTVIKAHRIQGKSVDRYSHLIATLDNVTLDRVGDSSKINSAKPPIIDVRGKYFKSISDPHETPIEISRIPRLDPKRFSSLPHMFGLGIVFDPEHKRYVIPKDAAMPYNAEQVGDLVFDFLDSGGSVADNEREAYLYPPKTTAGHEACRQLIVQFVSQYKTVSR